MKYSLTLLAVMTCILSNGQYTPMSNYVQPAPNVASMGKYVDYPISYYTGTPNINIPLYDLKDGAANVSVSLSYHPSGIRVSEMASWVGLGWALNATGMISRSVRGAPDEGSKIGGNGYLPRGYYKDFGLSNLALLPYPDGNVMTTRHDSNLVMFNYTIPQMSAGAGDGEPDLFTFSMNGYGGKFIFDETRVPRLLSDDNIKIAVNYNGIDFTSWVITTPDGARFYFGENNVYERNFSSSIKQSLGDQNTNLPSSWLLTRIIYPNSKDTVYYNYLPETYSYFDLAPESFQFSSDQGANNFNQACTYHPIPDNGMKTTVTGYRLSSITTSNYKISFSANFQRQDLLSGSSNFPNQLDSVRIFNKQNQCIKQFLLSHAYFQSTTASNLPAVITGASLMNGDISDTKRLKLVSVTEYSGDGLSYKPPYRINYQESQQLPRRMSFDQDHWGFSNYAAGNANSYFTPPVTHAICSSTPTGAYREPRWPDMQAFSIKSIKDPLGALTNFEFEPHTASYYNGANQAMIGGLRIHKITVTDSLTGRSNSRSYDYGLGGDLYRPPQYLFVPINEYYYSGYSWPLLQYTYDGYHADNNRLFIMMKQSQSIVPMQDFQGNHIGYSMVKEIFGNNGEGGYVKHYYMADQNVRDNSRLDIINFTAYANVLNGPGGAVQGGLYGNGHFNDIAPQNLVYYNGYNVNSYYPFAPQQVDFRHGQSLGEDMYDSANNLVRTVTNTYQQTYNESYWMRGFKVFRTVSNTGTAGPLNYDAMTFYKLHTGVSHLINSVTKDFKDGRVMTSTTRYQYESNLHNLKTGEITVNSTGDSIRTKTYYSFDYSSGADPVFAKMQSRNMLIPVSNRTWKNNLLIGGSITKFADFAANSSDTFINPVKIYALETLFPLSTSSANENINLSSQLVSLIPNSSFTEKANFKFDNVTGRISEQRMANDRIQSMIWDNGLKLPLAQTDNASSTDIAYTSFESSEKGNWIYTGSTVTDATAPTGTTVYNLGTGALSKNLVASQTYVVSLWSKSGSAISINGGTQSNNVTGRTSNGWTYSEITVTGTNSIGITGTGYVDEVRLYPVSAQMTTYTYDPLLRLIATCNANSNISRYEYDSFNRLVDIRDQDGYIIKAFEYNYGQLSR